MQLDDSSEKMVQFLAYPV